MENITLNNGIKCPVVGIGTFMLSPADAENSVREALNMGYRLVDTASLDIRIDGEDAKVIGKSRVTAAVFGGGKHTWRLELTFDLKKRPDGWKFVRAGASTW